MILNDEIYNSVISNNKKFTELDDNYCLLYKTMPCTDDELELYIDSINKAKANGINVTRILEYKLNNNITHTFKIGSYTKGVFLEEKAKGKCIAENRNLHLNIDDEYEIDLVANQYKAKIEKYLDELEKRANANQEIYDKLVNDYMELNKYNLTPDPKPLNFFFDENTGFTIIDLLPTKELEVSKNMLPMYMYLILFGYGLPKISICDTTEKNIPVYYKNRLDKCILQINKKIFCTLNKVGVNKDIIQETMTSFTSRFNFIGVEKDFIQILNERYYNIKGDSLKSL